MLGTNNLFSLRPIISRFVDLIYCDSICKIFSSKNLKQVQSMMKKSTIELKIKSDFDYLGTRLSKKISDAAYQQTKVICLMIVGSLCLVKIINCCSS